MKSFCVGAAFVRITGGGGDERVKKI